MKRRAVYWVIAGIAIASSLVLIPLAAATLDPDLIQHTMPSSTCSAESRREASQRQRHEERADDDLSYSSADQWLDRHWHRWRPK